MSIFAGRNWQKAIYLLPLFFPLYLVKLELAGWPFNVLELLVIGLFLLQLGTWMRQWFDFRCRGVTTGSYFLRQNSGFLLASALFLLLALVAVLIVPRETLLIDGETVYQSRRVALGILKGWILVPWLWFVMLWFNTVRREDLFTMFYAYVFSALPLAVWAFYQYWSGDFITLDGRASGPFVNANYLAMYLAPAVTALWMMIVRGVLLGFRPVRFVVGAFLAMLYSITMLMTQSYGAMLAVMLSLAAFLALTFLLHRREGKSEQLDILKKIATFIGVVALIALMSAVVLFANTEKWRLFTEFAQRSSSSVRLQVYQIAVDMVRQSPLLGIGFGQFEPKYNLEAPEILGHAPHEWVMIHPHNTFLAVWLNLGLGGLALFVWLLWYACSSVFRGRWMAEADYEEKFFRLIGGTLLLVLLLHGMVDTYIFKNDLAMQFWMIIALCVLPHRKKVLQSGGNPTS